MVSIDRAFVFRVDWKLLILSLSLSRSLPCCLLFCVLCAVIYILHVSRSLFLPLAPSTQPLSPPPPECVLLRLKMRLYSSLILRFCECFTFCQCLCCIARCIYILSVSALHRPLSYIIWWSAADAEISVNVLHPINVSVALSVVL